jgi:molybdate transport system substrate-binding protein
MFKLFSSIVMLFILQCSIFAAEITISAGVGLKDALNEISSEYIKKYPDVKIIKNFAASGVLAKQIQSGGPADIFFSANLEWMDFLKEKKLLDSKTIQIFAFNVIVFAGKPGLNVKTMQELVKLDKIAIGSPKSVPAGDYAMQAFRKAGIEKQLEGKLVMAKDVRECLLYAEKGEVEGAFVYKTDAEEMAKNVKILFTVPQDMYSRVTYPMALTVTGSKNPDAVALYKFLQTDKAKAVLVKHGFIIK